MTRAWMAVLAALLGLHPASARTTHRPGHDPGAPVGVALEGYEYPYPVQFLPLERKTEGGIRIMRLAYMDVPPATSTSGHVVVILPAQDLPASTWYGNLAAFAAAGWRAIVIEPIGFGKSAKPEGKWQIETAISDILAVLDKLGVQHADIIGEAMGAMIAVPLAQHHPDRVRKLVLESPLGLEDLRKTVPDVPRDQLYKLEIGLTPEAYLFALTSNYHPTLTSEQLQPFIQLRERLALSAEFPRWADNMVAAYQAIRDQPIDDTIKRLTCPILMIAGERDRAAPGRAFAKEVDREKLGQIARLSAAALPFMPDAQLVRLDVGHMPHLEQPELFNQLVLDFLRPPPQEPDPASGSHKPPSPGLAGTYGGIAKSVARSTPAVSGNQ